MNKKIIIAIALMAMLFTTAAFAQTSQTIVLKSGFNFVSFTTALSLSPSQFKALNSSIEDVYLYSAAAGSFLSINENTLTSLAAGKGYIVKNSSASNISITVPGNVISSIGNITLKTGFNLVGFSRVPASMTFKQLMDAYSMIKGIYKWSAAAGSFIQVVRDASGTVVLLDGTDPSFGAGDSYFFNLTSDTSINYDGTSVVVGATAVNPNAAPATISGTLNSAAGMAELGLNYQTTGEDFDVTLVDYDGNAVPSISLDAGETNPKTVKDGQAYSFKTKDFTKSYKVIAKSKTTANKMLSTFVGKVKENETVQSRDVNPIATAMGLIYADPTKDASVYKQEEQTKKQDTTFMKRLSPVVADLENKRSSSLKDFNFSNPAKLEQAYKDAILGSNSQQEINKIKEGLDAVIGKLEEQLSIVEKLKDALSLVATSGRRQNETFVKESKTKIKSLLTAEAADPLKDTTNKQVYKEAKISFGLVCKDLGDLFKNKVSSTTAAGAPNLMAAYQVLDGALDAKAKAEYEEGYNAVKDVTYDESDKAKGLDKSGSAAILKNASELAKEDPAKLDEAKKKADVLISQLESEGKSQVNLPTGEALEKDKILEAKGEALINGGRPTEAVGVFEDVSEPRVKNFGLGRAYLQLNDLEFAYKNLKDSVKDIVKSSNGFENRMNVEAQFGKINEAIFAFAAVLDKIKNGTESDVMQIKSKIKAEEQLEGSSEQVMDDPSVTLSKMMKDLKPTSNFFEVGKKFSDGQTGFGGQFAGVTQETDTLKKAFQSASKLMFKSNQIIDKARLSATEADRKKYIYEGKTSGTLTAPAADTALKYLTDAEAAFKAIFENTAVTGVMKGDAHYHLGLALMSQYRAYKLVNIENKDLISKAKEMFLTIRTSIYEAEYAHLEFAITQMIKNIENIENEMAGVVVEDNSIYKIAEKTLEGAENFYFDGRSSEATTEFDKAFAKFDESYKSTDTKITAKMKEAALYYSGYCLFYKFKLMVTPDETVKVKVMERLKLFKLKFPNSEFANAAGDMVNDVTSNISTLGPTDINAAKPGTEFAKAISLMEKLRLYYRNNFSTTEIETAFNQAKLIFEEVAVKLTTDAKYIGTFGDLKFAAALKDFRAHAKFMLGILYMERFSMPMAKEINYKNLALQFFNELVMNDYNQPFIPDVKRFISQLKEEIKTEFMEGDPIITDLFLNQHMLSVEQVKAGSTQLILTAGVVIPDAAAGVTVTAVKAELKKFGNTVFSDTGSALKDLAFTKVISTVAGGPQKWELKLTPPKNLEVGPYDFKVVATTSNSKTTEAYAPFVVEGQTTYSRIMNVNVMPNGGTSHVFKVNVSNAPSATFINEPGKYTDVYVSVMVQQYGSMMQSLDYSQDVKLAPGNSTTGNEFALDIAKELPNLKQGSYTFLFKLVNFNPADPVNSMSMPVDARPFDFFVQGTLAGADNQIVLNLYNKVIENFSSTKTAAEKVSAFELMCDSALPTEMKNALTTAFSSVTNLKFTVVGTPFVQYENNFNGEMMIGVYAPWKLSGTYSKDVLQGVVMPDGKMILPPGKTGAQIMDFIIKGDFTFAKRYANGVETWLINMGGGGQAEAPVTSNKPVITSFAGVQIPAAGGQITVPSLTNMPMVELKGTGLQSYEPEVKRILRILGPNLQFPLVLSDSGSYEWQSELIKFTSDKLKGLKGLYNLEMLDSKYGPIANVQLNFMDTGVITASAILFQITSGTNSAQPFNLIRPFEVDRNFDLIIKGDKLVPTSGAYSLRYFNPMTASTSSSDMSASFVEIVKSTSNTNWTMQMITVKKEQLPTSAVLTDGMPTSIVVWDNTANKPASSQVPVVFLSQTIDQNQAQAVINTVNGYDAKATVMIDKKAADTMANIDVIGSGFNSFTSRHLDLVLQINGRPVHMPIAYSSPMAMSSTMPVANAGWSDGYIKGTINYNQPVPVMDPTMPAGEMLGAAVTKYPCGLVIWDDKLQSTVTPFMVALKFMATTTTMPIITKVNGFEFYGSPIELTTSITDLKIEGQNLGDQSAMGNKGLYLKSQPTPMNPRPTLTMLSVMSWSSTMISATIPAAMMGGVYELFIGETNVASPMTYVDPMNIIPISKIVLVNFKSSQEPTAMSAFISNIEAYGTVSATPIVTSSTAASIAIPSEAASIKFMGKGLKSTTNTLRSFYMRLKGTNDWKYLINSNSILWTDNAITVKLYDPKPVGAFEIFIAETDFGAVIVSNIINVVFGQAAGGATINSINSIAITAGMMVNLKSDFTQLEIMGLNFGANADKSLIVRFVPFPDPTNPNPTPFEFPTISWSESFIKVSRPNLAAGVKLMKGNIELFNKTLGKPTAVPVPVEFIDSSASNIPAVTGLKYDATMKKLMWNPATSATSSMMYAYIVSIDGMVYEVPMGIFDFPVNMLTAGEHKAMVQAKIPNTYPPQAGPFSTPVTFTAEGGTISNIPVVTGITYDSMMKAIKWVPVQTISAEGWTQYYVYIVEIDGTVIPNPMSMAEYPVMNLTSGTHKVRIQAQKPGSYPPESGPFSAPFSFTLEGGTGTAVPVVTGLTYEAAMNKLKWNPIGDTTTAAPYAYKLDIDGTPYGPFYMTEFMMPPSIAAGSHTAKVQAMMEAMPPQYGAFSAPITFTSVAGTTTGAPNIMTLTYEPTMKKLMWTTDAPAATMNVMYIVTLDNNPPMQVGMPEFYLPPAFPEGDHNATVRAQVFMNNMPIEGTPKSTTFKVSGGTTGMLMAPFITYDPATKLLSWSPVTPPQAGAMVEYKIIVDGMEKMMWATPTSLNLNNPQLISDFTVNHTINVRSVVYNLNMFSDPSNTVNTLGGGTTTSEMTGINAMNGEIMVNFMTAPMPAPTMADFVVKQSINGATPANVAVTSIMPYGASVKLMVPMIQPTNAAQVINVSVSYKNAPAKTATYNIPAGTTGTLGLTFNPMGGSYPNAVMMVTITPTPADAKVYFATNGADPVMDGTAVAGSKTVSVPAGSQAFMIKAMAHLNGVDSAIRAETYSTMGTTTTSDMTGITAMNGEILANFTVAPTPVPVLADFVVKQSINGAAEVNVAATSIMPFGTSYKLMVPMVPQTSVAQNVTVSVSYKGGAPKTATYSVPAGTGTTGDMTGITAMNGEVMANFTVAPTPVPVLADFVVKQSINGAAEVNVAATSIMPYGTSYKLMVPMVPQTSVAQNVTVSVSYKGGAPKTATYSVPAGTGTTGDMTGITAMNGEVMANFTVAPTPVPVLADFVVKQSINGAAEVNVAATSIMPYGTSYKLMVPMVPQTSVAQNVTVSVSYKGGAPKTATYSVPASAGTTATLTGISAMNGEINANFSVAPAVTPAIADFVVKFNGTVNTMTTVVYNAPMMYKITFPMINQTSTAQTFNVEVSYMGGTPQTGSFTIPAATASATMTNVGASNGMINVTLSAAPATTPVMADFSIMRSIDGGTDMTVMPTSVGGPQPTMVDIMVPMVPQMAMAQSVVYKVSYKGSAYMLAPAFNVPAQTGGTAPMAPTMTPAPMSNNISQVMLANTQGAEMYYVITNTQYMPGMTDPDPTTSGTLYTGPISISPTVFTRIIAVCKLNGVYSTTIMGGYNLPAAPKLTGSK